VTSSGAAVTRGIVAVATTALIITGCAPSPASELAEEMADAPDLDRYRLVVTVADPGVFDCFPTGGTTTMTFDVAQRRLSVSEPGDDDRPALVADDGTVALRPAAFSSGPDEWWQIAATTSRRSINRVVGPIVAELGLNNLGVQPTRSVIGLVTDADEVTRRGTNGYRIIDRGGDATVADLTLDDHGHVARVEVSAEDPRRPGVPDDTQASYVARYDDGVAESELLDVPVGRQVGAGELDALDNRPGACGAAVSP
jgi:hypothetical protein